MYTAYMRGKNLGTITRQRLQMEQLQVITYRSFNDVLFPHTKDICSRTGCDPLPSGLALALDIISIIGVSLSLAGIIITVVTLLVFK